MKRSNITLVVLVAALLVSASPPQSAQDWEQRGNEAFEAGRYAQAIACYEQAEAQSDAPGRVAFNHGVALFHLGKYREAEKYFRCRLESGLPAEGKARALFNLGTALMHVGDGRDAERLIEAISCFGRCLKELSADDDLATDARHNLELAKLLWRQVRSGETPPPDRDPSSPGDDRPAEQPPDNGTNPDPGTQPGTPGSSGSQRIPGGKTAPGGPQPIPTSSPPPPGAGHALPIPDSEQQKPLPPHEARELLRQASERITRERHLLQRGAPPGEGKNYPDW